MEDDGLDAAANPRCPRCTVVMRDVPGGWVCPVCGRTIDAPPVAMPPEFDGPTVWGG